LLGAFFEYALGVKGAPTCQQFNDLFVSSGLLQQIYDVRLLSTGVTVASIANVSQNLANVKHPDFAAVDRFIKMAKADYFATGNPRNVGANQFNGTLDEIQKMGGNFGRIHKFNIHRDTNAVQAL
jgi:hypothetical protein